MTALYDQGSQPIEAVLTQLVRLLPSMDDGSITAMIGVSTDTLEALHAEQARREFKHYVHDKEPQA